MSEKKTVVAVLCETCGKRHADGMKATLCNHDEQPEDRSDRFSGSGRDLLKRLYGDEE
jgi:hypothetical protein